MFQISTQVKYTHVFKKAAVVFHETKYTTFIKRRNTYFSAYKYLVMSIHVSMSNSFKVIARRSISGNVCLIDIIFNIFSNFMFSFISYFNPCP